MVESPHPSGPQALPVRFTRFFGRHAEIADLEATLERVRLLTLTGAPGCGKTRLAIEVAERAAGRYAAGVRFVELAPTSRGEQVANALAAAIDVAEEPGRPIADTLRDVLRPADVLIVLDNCEHVVEGAAELARTLLADCPGVRIVATSRLPLGLPFEQVWAVPPLDSEPAVELFADRAALASGRDPGQQVTPDVLVALCHRLSHLPLAIELTAAWTRVLSPHQIIERIDEADLSLRSEARGSPPRQATMEAAIDWSHQLLDPAEQALFARLSVFAGGFDLHAAEVVGGPDDVDVLAALTALVEHSLVIAEDQVGEAMRYRLLEPLRQFGAARLEARGETAMIRRRHAEHYVVLAERCDLELRGDQRARALGRLRLEDGNLLVALEWLRANRGDDGIRLCAALAQYWELQGRVNDGRRWMQHMLDTGVGDRRLRATALARAGRLAWRQRDHDRSRELLTESLDLKRQLDDAPGVARRLRSLALVVMSQGDPATALRLCDESITIFRAHGDEQGVVWALIFRGVARFVADDPAGGDADISDAVAVNRHVGNVAADAYAMLYRSYAACILEDAVAARTHLVRALAALRAAGGIVQEPDWLWASAALAAAEGRIHSALRLAGGADALTRRTGSHLNEQIMLRVNSYLERAGQEIKPTVADRLKAEGSKMPMDQLISVAIAEPDIDTIHPLSPREHEVAVLVADGLANAEIAEQLYISKRTVESHVEHIKQKLGLHGRHQIIAWVLQDAVEAGTP